MIIQRTRLTNEAPFDFLAVLDRSRMESGFDDEDFYRMAHAAALEIEGFAHIALLEQTISVTVDEGFRRQLFDLPIAPLVDPLSVHITVDGATFEAFAVITGTKPAIRFEFKPCGVVVITYKAGFGQSAGAIPQDLQSAIADQVAAMSDHRGGDPAAKHGYSPHFNRVAARYRRVSL